MQEHDHGEGHGHGHGHGEGRCGRGQGQGQGHGHGHGHAEGRCGHGHEPGFGQMHKHGVHGRMALMMHGGRARRGEIPTAVLALLREQDMHGYQMLQEISDRTGGAWAPSPGSIYPALQMLEDRGLVTSEKVGGKRVFSLTEDGRTHAETIPAEGPWGEIAEGDSPERDLRHAFGSLMSAASQIARVGSPEQVAQATAILNDARKQMYTLLAGDQ
ncbi:MAG: PadR family transcriptional regulator [Coriobacteriales bacterium]|nr:PadR family transcriptional regulator [Coriobacteriales bacterium]